MIRTIQVTVDSPWPTFSGGDIRNAFVAQSASVLGPLHVLSFGRSHPPPMAFEISSSHIPSFEGVDPWHRPHPQVRTMIELTGADIQFLENEVRRFAPQVAILEGVTVAAALPVFRSLGVPVIIDMHNIESELYRSIWRSTSISRYLRGLLPRSKRWRALRLLDRDVSLTTAETWVTSDLDRSQLMRMGGADSVTVPNPIPNEELASLSINVERYAAVRALFVGHLAYPPNVTAVRELAKKIMPAVRQVELTASLLICGRSPAEAVLNLDGTAGIEVISNPTHLNWIYERSGYCLMPIRQGGGTRIKVLESMVAGTIVIATNKAVEGLGLSSGEHYLLADRPRDFLRHIEQCCANPKSTAALAQNAREFATTHFGKDRLSKQIHSRLVLVANNGKKR